MSVHGLQRPEEGADLLEMRSQLCTALWVLGFKLWSLV